MSFFEKKTERIHRGSPPTVLHTHTSDTGTHIFSHPHIKVSHTGKQAHTRSHTFSLTHTYRAGAGLDGKHQTPREEGGQAFPTFRLCGYFRCQAKNRANVKPEKH